MKIKELSFYGFLTPFGGYGRGNLEIIKNLIAQGIDVYVSKEYVPEPGTMDWYELTQEERDILQRPFKICEVGIVSTTPWEFGINKSPIKIAYTMIENTVVGTEWLKQCNKMDYIFVPNEFNRQCFIASGVNPPIYVVPYGVNTEEFKFTSRILPKYEPVNVPESSEGRENSESDKDIVQRPKKKNFVFGSLGYLNIRKGVFELISAFASEFAPNEPVELHLHSSNPHFGYYRKLRDPRITVSTQLNPRSWLPTFYHTIDCFVFPTRAEGVGLPPMEAMATGLPTIVTNWSGPTGYIDPNVCYPLEVEKLWNRGDLEQPGDWAVVDIPQLMYWLRHVYENQEEAYAKGARAAAYMQTHFTWRSSVEKLIATLEGL